MSKRDPRRINIADFKDTKRREGAVEIVVSDDFSFTIDPPELWPDAVTEAGSNNDTVAMAKLLAGEDNYARFVEESGLGANALLFAVRDEVGADVGESAASSDS